MVQRVIAKREKDPFLRFQTHRKVICLKKRLRRFQLLGASLQQQMERLGPLAPPVPARRAAFGRSVIAKDSFAGMTDEQIAKAKAEQACKRKRFADRHAAMLRSLQEKSAKQQKETNDAELREKQRRVRLREAARRAAEKASAARKQAMEMRQQMLYWRRSRCSHASASTSITPVPEHIRPHIFGGWQQTAAVRAIRRAPPPPRLLGRPHGLAEGQTPEEDDAVSMNEEQIRAAREQRERAARQQSDLPPAAATHGTPAFAACEQE